VSTGEERDPERAAHMTTPTRVSADAQGQRTTFDDIDVGAILGEMDWTVTPEMVETQCRMDLDYDAFFSVASPWGEPIAPPQLQYRPPRWLLSRTYNIRGLFYRWKMENVKPIRPGTTLHVKAWVLEKYVKNEREYVVFAAQATDPQGDVVFRTERTHVLDFVERTAPRVGDGVDSGIKKERI
jgi:acyl dehydratase